MSTESILEKTKSFIEHANQQELKRLDDFLDNVQYNEPDWWMNTPEIVRQALIQSREESRISGIPHEEVLKMHPQWFRK